MCAVGWAEGNISRPNLVEELEKKNFVFNKGLVRQWGGRGCIRFTNENSSNHDPRGGPPHHPLSSWERTSPRFAPTLFFSTKPPASLAGGSGIPARHP